MCQSLKEHLVPNTLLPDVTEDHKENEGPDSGIFNHDAHSKPLGGFLQMVSTDPTSVASSGYQTEIP